RTQTLVVVLPIHGEVAPPHSWGGGAQRRRGRAGGAREDPGSSPPRSNPPRGPAPPRGLGAGHARPPATSTVRRTASRSFPRPARVPRAAAVVADTPSGRR